MNKRSFSFLLLTLTLLLIALSIGAAVYYLLFLMMLALAVLAFFSTLATLALLRTQVTLPRMQVVRGDNVSVRVMLSRRCPLPVGQVELQMASSASPQSLGWMVVNLPPMRRREYRYSITCPHRGVYQVGITAVRVTDVFGLFTLKKKMKGGFGQVTVLPRIDQDKKGLTIEPGETGPQSRIRMTEDTSSPAGVRSWQEGDELKKVHWKLSMRKRELMVRTYEESARPDTLILLDLSPVSAAPSQIATLEDALCETAGAMVLAQLKGGNPIRMPLHNAHPTELAAQFSAQFETILNELTHVRFDSPYSYEQILALEMRRMQRTGGVVLITTHLSSQIADFALRMRQLGLSVCLSWVASNPRPESMELLAQLDSCGIFAQRINPWNT